MYYSQGMEEDYIIKFFINKAIGHGMLLSIGENDGKTFSNSLRLIELGWDAVLIEPAPETFQKLKTLHADRPNVRCIECAITETDGTFDFWDSGSHIGNGDSSLLSTVVESELDRWPGSRNEFVARKVKGITYESLELFYVGPQQYKFISIDAEGLDLQILKQIDLRHTELLCIEWNSNSEIKSGIMEYTAKFGMNNIIYQNGENLLIAR